MALLIFIFRREGAYLCFFSEYDTSKNLHQRRLNLSVYNNCNLEKKIRKYREVDLLSDLYTFDYNFKQILFIYGKCKYI